MVCRLPELLRDEQLLAYLDGESTPAIARHLESCSACRARLTALTQSEHKLTTAFYRRDCPPSLLLGEYKLALLPAAEHAAITQHLVQCPHCTLEVAQLQDFWAALEIAPETAPEIALAPSMPPFALAEQVRVVIARLRDGLQNLGSLGALAPSLVPVRGGESAQQIFDTGEGVQIIVDSQLDEAAHQQRTLLGLIVGIATPAALTAALWQAERCITTTAVDALGNFVLTDLPTGTYTLLLSNAETAYQIDALQL